MKNERHLIVLSVIICQLFYSVALTSCSDDETSDSTPVLKGKITSYNEFGAAMLDFTEADMINAGFSLGDEAQLPNIDYAKAFSSYLLSHGMSQQQLDALVHALTVPNP